MRIPFSIQPGYLMDKRNNLCKAPFRKLDLVPAMMKVMLMSDNLVKNEKFL